MTIKLTDKCAGDVFEYNDAFEMYETLRNAADKEDLPEIWKLCTMVQEHIDGMGVGIIRVNRYAASMQFRVEITRVAR